VDVQGAELVVLGGAEKILANAVYVVLETSLFETYKGAPSFADVVRFMQERGSVLYDLAGLSHRPLDGALAQVDAAFVPEKSPLRKDHAWATAEQRRKQNRHFEEDLRSRGVR
jgi:hypothetical protein